MCLINSDSILLVPQNLVLEVRKPKSIMLPAAAMPVAAALCSTLTLTHHRRRRRRYRRPLMGPSQFSVRVSVLVPQLPPP